MPMDIYNTYQLIAAIEGIDPRPSFLANRYFPTNDALDISTSSRVFVEEREGQRGLAGFSDRNGTPVMIGRAGQKMREYEPPIIAPGRALTLDDIKKRGFGEPLMGTASPEVRAALMTVRDMDELDGYITRREEAMAAEVMLTNGCTMESVTDDLSVTVEDEIRFYEEDSNPATMAFDVPWNDPKAPILDYLHSMSQYLTSRGLPASDLVVAPDVAHAIIGNEGVQKMLDNRRVNIGEVAPKLEAPGAALVCQLNVYGHMIDVISYEQTYVDSSGAVCQYIPAGKVVMTAPGAGRKVYGAVTQLEDDNAHHTYSNRRVPRVLPEKRNNMRVLVVTSCPLLLPNAANPFLSATAVF